MPTPVPCPLAPPPCPQCAPARASREATACLKRGRLKQRSSLESAQAGAARACCFQPRRAGALGAVRGAARQRPGCSGAGGGACGGGRGTAQVLDALHALPRLPATRQELLAVAQALGADPATALYLDAQATVPQVRALNGSSPQKSSGISNIIQYSN